MWFFDSATSAIEAFSLPGFKYMWTGNISNNGDLVGSVASKHNVRERRGSSATGTAESVSWEYPTVGSGPLGAVSILSLNAINDLGHAVASSGTKWARI